ncbi:MAG: toll/interleukin-1 receptor domain-containing protein, partial [Deltaproteobacteria bacterium]|nr:toll/interleukin-1 receptor domain-containing protein [Deltaproteobacteria bacterium]
MRIFISFANEQSRIAESIYRKLLAADYEVFFASDDIRASDDFDDRIRREVAEADRMIFLASRESLTEGKFTLTELRMFSKKWPDPTGRVMTVVLDDTSYDNLPPYLGAVTSAFKASGNIPSEVAATVVNRWPRRNKRWGLWGVIAASVVVLVVAVFLFTKKDTTDTGNKSIPPIEFNTGEEAMTLIFHSHTLSRKDTFQIDPIKTVKYLKNSLKRHYEITIPKVLSERIDNGGYFLEDVLVANHSPLWSENETLAEAGLKEFDVIEFDYRLTTTATMACRIPDVKIVIEGIRSSNPEFTLNGPRIPDRIEKKEGAHYFYFDIINTCNPSSWTGKLVLG